MANRYFITGSNGQLGGKLSTLLPGSLHPTRSDLELSDYGRLNAYFENNSFDVVIHCAAKTSPPVIDKDPGAGIKDNIIATANLAFLCSRFGKKLVYVSTDYVYAGDTGNYKESDPVNPVNLYALSKLGGECAARMVKDHLVLRLSFGPDAFPYEKAWIDQYTSRETLSVIAEKIVSCLDLDYNGIINLGSERISVFDYAVKLKPDVIPVSIKEASFNIPKDTSLDTSLYKNLKK